MRGAQCFAEAFGAAGGGRQSWRYQYSLQPSFHGADLDVYWPLSPTFPDAGFRHAFQRIWGSFIRRGRNGPGEQHSVPGDPQRPGMILWSEYSAERPFQMVLNTTGGVVLEETLADGQKYPVRASEGIVNAFRVVDAVEWEGGRGERCAFWLSVSPRVPQ
ncbi:hypothetical protein ESCO_001114 [Escovopsis weberi]|uniref:Carboxylesterase type B domain-containing protein n=1 Tax=Escovopsis weberi TaxID=150374 RepID=A0A0M9VTS0_ESCWE|nr:hypothetical protein ESCO_001114 [Escovopsis weberi]